MPTPELPKPLPSRAELAEARDYLKRLDVPADDYLLGLPEDYVRIGVLRGRILGMSDELLRQLAEDKALPYSEMPMPRADWRFYVPGVVWYVAVVRGYPGLNATRDDDGAARGA